MSKKKKQNHQARKPAQKQVFEGLISTTARGVGYVPHPEMEEDLQVSAENANTALHGDKVRVEILPQRKGERRQARVLNVVKRARTTFVGTVVKENGAFTFEPDDHRIYIDFLIPSPPKDLQEHDKVIVEWKGWDEPGKQPKADVREVLGKAGIHEVEMQAILFDKGIDRDFPERVLAEAEAIKEGSEEDFKREIASGERRDFREIDTFTIDPDTAKDFDDALSYKKLDNGNIEVGIHIADVSHYVKPKTEIDKEARKRGFSTYLVDRTIPMLPEVLSNDLCSLNPKVDRLAFSAVFELDSDGGVHSRWFGKSIIYSDRRFTYEDAQKSIDEGGEYSDELRTINAIAKILRGRRFKEGAIDFADDEVKFILDEVGEVLEIRKKERLDTHKLVEEYMLLANREVAKKVDSLSDESGREHPFIYRVHDLPDREKLEELGIFLRAIGYDFYVEEKIDPKDINVLLEKVRGKAEEGIVSTSILRAMAKAAYSTTSTKGHFGLAFEYYTHFTSPIRRYSDLLAHRLLLRHLHGEKIANQELSFIESTSADLSEIERNILEAERASIKYKQVEYLKEKIGEEFDAIITGVSEYGFYVEEEHTRASGMVNVRALQDDYYELDRKNYAIVGRDRKKKYAIGDEVRVKLVKADMDRRQLDFKVVDSKE